MTASGRGQVIRIFFFGHESEGLPDIGLGRRHRLCPTEADLTSPVPAALHRNQPARQRLFHHVGGLCQRALQSGEPRSSVGR